jgi:gas vesicle structural protein
MSVERASGGSSLVDVLDRILDKGVVVEASVRISAVAIDLANVDTRVVVASADTYLGYGETGAGSRAEEPGAVP